MKRKFNIVDWVVIGLVVVVAGFFGIRWFQNSQVEISYGEITYTVLVEAVPEESCADIDRHLPDQLMSSGALVGGEVVSVEYSDCSVQSIEKSNSSNDYITVTVDPYGEYKNAVFTIKSSVNLGDLTTSVGKQEIRTGRSYIIKTEHFELSGTILTVEK